MSFSSPKIAAFDDLKWLRHFATAMARDADLADDLVQDTLVDAWQELPGHGLVPDSGNARARGLRPWLATVLRNRFRMYRRGESRRVHREQASTDLQAGELPDQIQERLEVLTILLSQLRELPGQDQELIVHRFFEGHSAADIGRARGVPAATIRSQLRRTLAQLRSSLDRRYGARANWCAAVLTVPGVGTAQTASSVTGSKTMSITLKLLLATTTLCGAGVVAWVATGPEPKLDLEPQANSASSHASTSPRGSGSDNAPRAAWQSRRAQIHRQLADTPAPATVGTIKDGVHAALHSSIRACAADLGEGASEVVTIDMHEVGAPDLGTIIDSVEIAYTTIDNPELLECVKQSTYAVVGEAPSEPYDAHTSMTVQLGKPRDASETQRRIVHAITGAHIGEVRFCGTKVEPSARGSAQLSLTMGTDGMAAAVVPGSSDLPAPVMDCIVAAMLRWKYPESMAGKAFEFDFVLPVPTAALAE